MRDDQRGSSEPVAFIALVPLVLFVVMVVLQVGVFAYAAIATDAAARDAARTASLGDNPYTEIRQVSKATGVKMWANVVCDKTTNSVRVSVMALAPKLIPVISSDSLYITRHVEQPMEIRCGA